MESFARREMECFSCVGRGGGANEGSIIKRTKRGSGIKKECTIRVIAHQLSSFFTTG